MTDRTKVFSRALSKDDMNNKEKSARFRELAKHDQIRTASQLVEELEQPFLPLIKASVTGVEKHNPTPTGPEKLHRIIELTE